MPTFYGPPSDGTVIPKQLGDVLATRYAQVSHTIAGSRTVALGDSIEANTQGWFPYWAIETGTVFVARNSGVSGDTTGMMLARFDADVVAHNPDVVIIGGATNDHGQGIDEAITRANVVDIIDRVIEIGATPVLRTAPPIDVAAPVAPWNTVQSRRQAVHRHNGWLRAYAAHRGVAVLDLYQAAADPVTGGFKATYSSDGIHPNEVGAKLIADYLIARGVPAVFNGRFPLARAVTEDGNLLGNGVFHDSAADGLADGWLLSSGAAAATLSVTAGEPGVSGNWQRIASTGTEVVAVTRDINAGASTYEVGDTLEFCGRVRTSGDAIIRLQVMAYGGTGSVDAIYNASRPIEGGVFSGLMYPRGANLRVRILVQVNAGPAGWVEVAEIAVRNLTKLGLA